MDEQLPVAEYLRRSALAFDGRMWLVICAASLVAVIDMLAGSNWLPLRELHDPAKAAVLLAFSPVITLLALIVARQIPFSHARPAVLIRGFLLVAFFLLLNF